MNNILMVFGGNSVEHEISVITTLQTLRKYKGKYKLLLCYLKDGCFYYVKNNVSIKDFSNIKRNNKFKKISFKANKNYFFCKLKKIEFEGILISAHGMNCEDGTLYSYFKTLNLNVISENLYSAVIGQDKTYSKIISKAQSVPFLKINHFNYCNNLNEILEFATNVSYPLILKPNKLGSSVGINVIYNVEELIDKIEELLNLCDSLILEKKLESFEEYNIALLKYNNGLIVSEIEKVSNNKILTYDDKYKNNDKSMCGQEKQLPAQISKKLKNELIRNAKDIYINVDAQGIVRIDFLYDVTSKTLYFNEINNIPGSLSTYLFEKANISSNDLIDMYIDEGLKNLYKDKKIITYYEKNILNDTTFSSVKFNK